MYSKKATGIFIVFSFALISSLVYIGQGTDLFKGQLILNQTDLVNINVVNCPNDTCSNPSLIIENSENLRNLELLVKESDTNQVVYAEYLSAMDKGSRYEVSFASDLCGIYSYDAITYRYNLDATNTCQINKSYEFIVSAELPEGSAQPLITEAYRFTLAE